MTTAVLGISALANSNINFPGEWAKDSNLLLNEKKNQSEADNYGHDGLRLQKKF